MEGSDETDILGGLKRRRKDTWNSMKEVVNAAEKRSTWTEADEKRYTALTEDLSTIDVRIAISHREVR
ncbi:MAG: hypothetical protein M3454_04250 [Actinomycetota bacterium]|nr:hypothetical protein [Actinomycetota bacterium]